MAASDYDVAVVGGGLVGVATAWGLAREGCRVVVLDEGDRAVRASRGNFALVWVQSKGLGLAPYAGWTIRSSNAWAGFAETLKEETGLDVCFQRPGGFHLSLSERELEARANSLKRLHNQPGIVDYKTEILDHAQVAKMLPDIGPEVVGGSYCPLDGHVNSLRLFRTLHTAINARGVTYLPSHRVETITRDGGEFRLDDRARRDPRQPRGARRRQRQHAAGADGRARMRRCGPSAARSSSPSGCGRSCAIPSSPCARPTRAR